LIKWPTILFTLLLATRFILEILKEVKARDTDFLQKMTPLNMNMDANPVASAAVGIYIFVLFVYNHSLEFETTSSGSSRCSRNLNTDGANDRCTADLNDDCRNGFDDRTRLLPQDGSQTQALASPTIVPVAPTENNNFGDHGTSHIGRTYSRRSSNNFQPLVNDDEQHSSVDSDTVHSDSRTEQPTLSTSSISVAIQENEENENRTEMPVGVPKPSRSRFNITENTPMGTNTFDPVVASGSGTFLQLQNIEKPTDKGDSSWTYTPFEFFHKQSKPSRFFAQNKIDAV